MLRAMLFMVTVLSCGSTAMAGLRDECLGLFGIAVDDIGILTCTASAGACGVDGSCRRAAIIVSGHIAGRGEKKTRKESVAADDLQKACGPPARGAISMVTIHAA